MEWIFSQMQPRVPSKPQAHQAVCQNFTLVYGVFWCESDTLFSSFQSCDSHPEILLQSNDLEKNLELLVCLYLRLCFTGSAEGIPYHCKAESLFYGSIEPIHSPWAVPISTAAKGKQRCQQGCQSKQLCYIFNCNIEPSKRSWFVEKMKVKIIKLGLGKLNPRHLGDLSSIRNLWLWVTDTTNVRRTGNALVCLHN